MPTYEYECLTCKHRFELFQSMTDKPVETCPECGKKVRRLINGGMGVIFKGSGFYSTDHRSGGGGNGYSKKSEDTAPASEKTSSSSDSTKTGDSSSSSSQKKEPAKSKK